MSPRRLLPVVISLAVIAGGLVILREPAQTAMQMAALLSGVKPAPDADDKVAIQVNQNDKAVMELALDNAKNNIDFYKSRGDPVAVEIVAYGAGLHMLRRDTSPEGAHRHDVA